MLQVRWKLRQLSRLDIYNRARSVSFDDLIVSIVFLHVYIQIELTKNDFLCLDVVEVITNDAEYSTHALIDETNNDSETTGTDTDVNENDVKNSNDGHQNKANSDATDTGLDSNSKQRGKEGVIKINNDKDAESCAGILRF